MPEYLPLPGQPSTPPPMGPPAPYGYTQSGGQGPSMQNARSYAQPMIGGYNDAINSLQQSLNLNNSTYAGGQMRLGTQLNQNRGALSQQLANRGLGNTTIAGTMAQAPMQTYNQGMADLGDQAAQRGMAGFNNLAAMQAQGGQAISNFYQPYGTAEYGAGLQGGLNAQQNQAASQLSAQGAGQNQAQATLQGQIQGGLNTQQNQAAVGLQGTALTAEAQRQQEAQNAAMAQLQQSLANQRGMQATGIQGQQVLQGGQIASNQLMQQRGIRANTSAAATQRANQLQDYQAQQQALEQQRLIASLHAAYSQVNAGGGIFDNSNLGGFTPGSPTGTVITGASNPTGGTNPQGANSTPIYPGSQTIAPNPASGQGFDALLQRFGGNVVLAQNFNDIANSAGPQAAEQWAQEQAAGGGGD